MGICEKYFKLNSYKDYLYFVFRVFVGLLFLQHGLQKLFGMFGGLGGQSAELFSLMGLAGTIETLGGLRTPLIDKNTTIPTKAQQVFSTA